MIDEQEYNKMVNAMAEFVGASMKLWTQQKEVNIVLQKQIEEHLEIFKIHQNLMRDLRDQNIGYKVLLVEHEKRLLEIEQCLREETIYRGFDMPKGN